VTLKATFLAAFPEARRISNFLERDYGEAGVAVSLDERTDGLWSVDAYFEEGEPEALAQQLRDGLGGDGFGAPLTIEALQPTDWIAAGLQALQPVSAGRFVVHGSHSRGTLFRGRIPILIDAGQAFGTGHHPTTRGCLAVLDQLVRMRRFEKPLDLGTGSGVLAIALAKMLRRPVLASDIDPLSVRIASANAALNHVGPFIHALKAHGTDHPMIRAGAPYDLIVANILAGPLSALAPAFSRMLTRGGTLVLSGLLHSQRERVIAAYGMQAVHLEAVRRLGVWCVLILRKR
jgi:ribosomal protein L11 methyltransferase